MSTSPKCFSRTLVTLKMQVPAWLIWLEGARIANESIWDLFAQTPFLSTDGLTHDTQMTWCYSLSCERNVQGFELSGSISAGGDGGTLVFDIEAEDFGYCSEQKCRTV